MESISEGGEWDEELRQGGVAGTQFAEVEVDTETGALKVIKNCRRSGLWIGNQPLDNREPD